MYSDWSTHKLLANIEERDKEIDRLELELKEKDDQLDDADIRIKRCTKVLWSLLHPEELGWAVSQEVRKEVKQTLIKIGEYYERAGTEV